jgi:hypothetical protein
VADDVANEADPDVLGIFDSHSGAARVCRVCGSLVAAADDYLQAHWDWHEASNGA